MRINPHLVITGINEPPTQLYFLEYWDIENENHSLGLQMNHSKIKTSYHRGFTVPELLAVIALIVIVISLLMPSLGQARQSAWQVICSSNLHQLRISLQGTKGVTPHARLPQAGVWTSFAARNGAGPAMTCPVDVAYHQGAGGIDELNVVQWEHSGHPDGGHVTSVPMSDIIAGNALADNQISWFRNDAVHRGGQLDGEDDFKSKMGVSEWTQLPNNIVAVSIDWSGRFSIDTNTNMIHVYDKWQGNANGGGSRHFIYDLAGELLEIGGGTHSHTNNVSHQGYDPQLDFDANGTAVSYGMNVLIRDQTASGGQVLLLDYEKSIVNVGTTGYVSDDMDERFGGRHFGKANVLRVDSSVTLMAQSELEDQPEEWLPQQ